MTTPGTAPTDDRPTVAQLQPGDVLQLQGQLVLVAEIQPTDDGLLTLRLAPTVPTASSTGVISGWKTAPMRPTAQLQASWTARPTARPGRQAERH
jgi:hypothetical protein